MEKKLVKLWKYTVYSHEIGFQEEKTNFFLSRSEAEKASAHFAGMFNIVSSVEYAGRFTPEHADELLRYGIYDADWEEWVYHRFENCVDYPTPMTMEEATSDFAEFRRSAENDEGFCGVPVGLTEEEYMNIWNKYVRFKEEGENDAEPY
jgi:hypothetical protein